MIVAVRDIPAFETKDIAIEVMRRRCLSQFLDFVRVIYKAKFGRDFNVLQHHLRIAEAMFKVFTGQTKRLIINVAPRYGKTELAVKMFISLGLAFNAAAKFIHLSYSDNLALDNSEFIKDYIASEAYQKLFPHVKIKKGSDSKQKWVTTDGGGVYATSTAGQVTGFGAGQTEQVRITAEDAEMQAFLDTLDFDIQEQRSVHQKLWNGAPEWLQLIYKNFFGAIIIDDPIKPEEAESEKVRTNINQRFDTTIRSRVNSKLTPIIIIMQRLHPDDLAGYLIRKEPGEWDVVSIPTLDTKTKEVLDPSKHTYEDLMVMKKRDPITYERQYQQNPSPREGLLYTAFETYVNMPPGALRARAYTDPADLGEDYLVQIIYKLYNNRGYIVDIIYTQERAEESEIMMAKALTRHKVEWVKIESNNGGRHLGRFTKIHANKLGNLFTKFEYYNQTKEKMARILNAAAEVNNFFLFPKDWEFMWPDAYRSLTGFAARGKNEFDDLEDVLTKIVEDEVINKGSKFTKK